MSTTTTPSILAFRIFPAHWDWRRVVEFGVTVYQAGVGAVAFVHPGSLHHTSYEVLLDMFSPQAWGLQLWAVALMHSACLAVNGRRPLTSTILRVVACTLHLGVMLLLVIAYYKVGDFYRMVTTISLTFCVLAALSIAAEDVARIIHRRRVIADERRPLRGRGDGVA